MVVGGAGLKATEMAGGVGGLLPPPPHAAATNAIAATLDIKIVLRDFTEHLR
jgi:hypothetical protein